MTTNGSSPGGRVDPEGQQPAAQVARDREGGGHEDVQVLREEEGDPLRAAVLREVAADELGVGLDHVERRAVGLREAATRKTKKPTNCGTMYHMPCWASTIETSDRRAGAHHDADEGQALRHLVGDELRGGAHGAQEGVLRARRPAAEHDPVEGDRAEGEDHERPTDTSMPYRPTGVPKMSTTLPNGMTASVATAVTIERIGARKNSQPIAVRGRKSDFVAGLDDLREGLAEAERPDPVGAVAVLEAPEQLALADDDERQDLQADREDHDPLEDLDPPRLGVADDGQHGRDVHGVTSTRGPSSAFALSDGMPSSRKAEPRATWCAGGRRR
jgi:hypothetical protein